MREQDFYIDFAETVLFVFAFSLLALVIARGIGFWRYTGRLWFPTRSVRIGFSVLCCSGVFFGLIGTSVSEVQQESEEGRHTQTSEVVVEGQ